jgi:FkbM family methyltransferase
VTPEQLLDKENVWKHVSLLFPKFTKAHDVLENYHTVREIVLSGSEGWFGANKRFKPFPDAKVMDVGANVGIYSAFCALEGARVTSYEPYQEAYDLLISMIENTNLTDYIIPISSAIWTYTGKRHYIGARSSLDGIFDMVNGGVDNKSSKFVPGDFLTAKEVSCISFNDAIGDTTWDCVKMDIEGAEFEVLIDTPKDALQKIKFMYLELHPWASQELYDGLVDKVIASFKKTEWASRSIYDGRWQVVYLSN